MHYDAVLMADVNLKKLHLLISILKDEFFLQYLLLLE